MDRRKILWTTVFTALLAALLFLFFFFWKLLAPFVLSYILFFLLKPCLTFLEHRGVRHIPAVCIVFFSVFGGAIVLIALLIPALVTEVMSINTNLSSYTDSLNAFLAAVRSFLASIPFSSALFSGGAAGFSLSGAQIGSLIQSLMEKVPGFLSSLLMFVLVVPFATFFFLLDAVKFSRQLVRLVPNRYFETVLDLMYTLNLQFGLILRGMFISVLIISVLSSAGLWIIGIKYPILIGTFAGITNLIPYAGPVIGAAAAFVSAIMTGAPPSVFLSVIVVFIIVQALDNIFVQPLVMSKSSNLHPLAVLFLVIAGSSFGVLGMVFIVPLTSLCTVVFRVFLSELNRPVRPDFSLYAERTD